MKALVTMHHPDEGPGTLGRFLQGEGVELEVIRLYEGHRLPDSSEGYDLVVSMGGPMGAFDDETYPWLGAEAGLLAEAAGAGKVVVGVCLGAQLLARALGGQVVKSPEKEIGWGEVELTDDGLSDPLFSGLPRVLKVFQWHEDMARPPATARILATNTACPVQAFVQGRAYGLQFHVEVDRDIVASWYDDDAARAQALEAWETAGLAMEEAARKIYANLMKMLREQEA